MSTQQLPSNLSMLRTATFRPLCMLVCITTCCSYDGDGWLDLAEADLLNSNRLYRNDGSGDFVTVSNDFTAGSSMSKMVAWIEYVPAPRTHSMRQ